MERRRLADIGAWLFAATLIGTPLTLGALRTPVLCVLALVLATTLSMLMMANPATTPRPAASAVFWLGVTLIAFTAFQAIPLPAVVVRTLSPHADAVWSSALAPLGEAGPRAHPLTLDPTATRVEVLRGIAYLLAFLCALRVAERPHGVRFLSRVLIAAAFIIAVVHTAHVVTKAERAYGLFRPQTAVTTVGPFFNVNNLAAYLNVGLMMAVCSLASRSPVAPRVALAVIAMALFVVEIWIGSRGGVVSMAIGLFAFAIRSVSFRRSERSARMYWAFSAAAVLIGAAMLVLGASETSLAQLRDKDISKVAVNVACWREMVPAYPLVGVGRGAFESAFPEFWSAKAFETYTHPENVLSQWATEWGVPITLLAVVVIGRALRPQVMLERRGAFGPWLACGVLFAHNLVDFSTEVPSVMVAGVVCAAIVVSGKARTARRIDAWSQHPRIVTLCACVATIASVALAVHGRDDELFNEKKRIHELVATNARDDQFKAAVRHAMSLHPAEPYFSYMGAARAYNTHAENVVPWITHTLDRARSYGPAHLLLARSLRRTSPSQSRLEYRLATEQGFMVVASAELASLVSSADDANELVPPGRDGARTLDSISSVIGARLPATQWTLDDQILRRDPTLKGPALRHARGNVRDLFSPADSPWCARQNCMNAADEAITIAERLDATSLELTLYRARFDSMGPRGCGALQKDVCDHVANRVDCLGQLADLESDRNCSAAVTETVDALARACSDAETCATTLLIAAAVERRRGNQYRALALLQNARATAPARVDVLEAYAADAADSGRHVDALEAYEKLLKMHPERGDYAEQATRERGAVNMHR